MWKAVFKDGTIVSEFGMKDNQEIPNSFACVMQNLENLDILSIIDHAKMFSVSMFDGKFTITQSGFPFKFYALPLETVQLGQLTNIRPIYFVRETVQFKEGPVHLSASSTPVTDFVALGFQGNINGLNIKRYLAILSDGTFTIEDK